VNDSKPSPPLPEEVLISSLARPLLYFAFAPIILVAACIPGGSSLLFGWFFFLDRSLASFQADLPTLWVGFTAFGLLFVIVHRMSRRWRPATSLESSQHLAGWTWRSTTALCLGMTLMFAASIAIIGSLHQLVWIGTGKASTSNPQVNWGERTGPLAMITDARRAAWKTMSRNNIKQMMLAIHNYESTYSMLPPGAIVLPDGRGYRGWIAPLGPFVPFEDPYYFENAVPWDDPKVARYGKGALLPLVHPQLGWGSQFDERDFAFTHYAGNVHIFPNNRSLRINEVTDGTSNTLAIGEVAENFQAWASPWNRRDPVDGINDVPWGFGGPTWQEGAQFGLVDGTVRLISRNIDRKILKALGTPSAGEEIPADLFP